MDLNVALKLINNPVRAKKRRGIRFIRGNLDKFEDLGEIVKIFTELLDTEDPIIKIEAQKTIIKLVEMNPNFLNDVLPHLERGLEADDPNVRFATISGFLRLLKCGLVTDSSIARKIIEKGLEDENTEVINSALRLLAYAHKRGLVDIQDYIQRVFDLFNMVGNKYTELMAIEVLLNAPKLLTDENRESIINKVMELAKDKEGYYRAKAVRVIGILIENDLVNENTFRTLLRKRLRDESDTVKFSTLEVIWKMGKNDVKNVIPYLDIISNEVLMKSRNKRLRLAVLRFLYDFVDKLPRDLIFRHELLKNISHVEKATTPKSPVLMEIKDLSNQILENKMGISLEERIKKF